MTQNKDLKRLVRARMRKTGEAYTTARAQLLNKRRRTTRAASATAPARPPAPDAKDYATLAGMSDAKIKEKTGCTWERWVTALDYHGANKLAHREIAELVRTKYKVGPWWTQSVAVGYERIKGLRALGQQRDGTYEMGKTRTYDVPVGTLYDAWADATARRKWLDGATVKVRTATRPKSIRFDWSDGGILVVGFTSKGASKSSVAVQHEKLPDRATADRLKQFWSERFDALGEALATT
jgi:uncharacterized protein YndB with AHSA1/START domain